MCAAFTASNPILESHGGNPEDSSHVQMFRGCDPVSDPSPSDSRCLSNSGSTLQVALNFQNFFKLQPWKGELTAPQPGKYLISIA